MLYAYEYNNVNKMCYRIFCETEYLVNKLSDNYRFANSIYTFLRLANLLCLTTKFGDEFYQNIVCTPKYTTT